MNDFVGNRLNIGDDIWNKLAILKKYTDKK